MTPFCIVLRPSANRNANRGKYEAPENKELRIYEQTRIIAQQKGVKRVKPFGEKGSR